MQTRYLRLVCRSREIDYPMYLDAPVETTGDGSMIVAKAMMSGFMHSDGSDLHPFVMKKEKADLEAKHRLTHLIDFGTDFVEPERYYHTNLPSKCIHKAAQFTMRWFDEDRNDYVDYIYEVREIIDLLRQQAVESL